VAVTVWKFILPKRYRLTQIKICLKAGFAVSFQDVAKNLAVLAETEPPNVGRCGRNEAHREGVGGEILLPGRTKRIGQAAVIGHFVGSAVFVPVVVFEEQALPDGRQYPGAGFVFAYPKRDAPFLGAALLHEHEEAGVFEGGRGFGRKNNYAFKSLAAQGGDVFEECLLVAPLSGLRTGYARAAMRQQNGCRQECEESNHGVVLGAM